MVEGFNMSARKDISVAVVGLGWMGQAHSRSLIRIPTLFPNRKFNPPQVMLERLFSLRNLSEVNRSKQLKHLRLLKRTRHLPELVTTIYGHH